jgi:hypothetical protein
MNELKPSIRYGLYLAVGLVLFHLLVYAINPEFLFNKGYGYGKMAITWAALPIFFMILGARDCKPNFEDYTFGNAFKAAFLVAIVGVGINLAYEVIINLADPEYGDWVYDTAIDMQMDALEDSGYSEEMLEQQRKGADMVRPYFSGSMGSLVTNFGLLVWYVIVALIVAATQKVNKQS